MNLVHKIKAKQYALYGLWLTILGAVFAWLQFYSLHIPFVVPFLFLFAFSLSVIFESLLIVFRNYKSLIAVNVIYAAAFCYVHWYATHSEFSLQTIFTYLLIIISLRLLSLVAIAFRNMRKYTVEEHPAEYVPGKMRSLWLHLWVYDVTQVLFNYVDKFIISLILAAGISAIYFNGSQTIPFLPLLLSAAGSAVLIQLAGGRREDEAADMIRLMNQTGKILSAIVFPFFFFLLFFRYELIVTLLSDKYVLAVPVFMVSILVLPLRAYSFTTVLQKMHKGTIINAGSVADLVLACALIYPLYKWLGLPGVALSFVISTYMQAFFYLFYAAKLLNTSPFKLIPYVNWLIKLIVFATLFIIIHYAGTRYFTGKIPLILGGVAMVVIVTVSVLMELNKQKKNVSI